MTAAEERPVDRLLEANQHAFFNAARRHFEQDVNRLRIHLGIPPRKLWPKAQALALGDWPDDARFDPRDGKNHRPLSPRNEDATIFRVRTSRRVAYMIWGAALRIVTAFVASSWAALDVTVGLAAGEAAGAIVAVLG